MASTLKTFEPFTGTSEEDVNKWIKKTLMKTELFNLGEHETKIMVLLLLKGTAEEWLIDHSQLKMLPLLEILKQLAARFTTQVSTEKILERFLKREEVTSVEEYEAMLQDASTLFMRESINGASIIKLVIKKTPTNIQSILYLLSQTTANWQEFRAKASEVTWLGFETGASVNALSYQKTDRRPRPKRRFFCKQHGENNSHPTEKCWSLAKPSGNSKQERAVFSLEEDDYQEDNNKLTSNYFSKNPFYKKISIEGRKEHTALIDTGADISMIHQSNLPKNAKIIPKMVKVRAANGETMSLTSKAQQIKAKIGETNFTFNPIITTTNPKFTIIGADALQDNPEIFREIDLTKSYPETRERLYISSVAQLKEEEVFKSRYKEMFKTEIDQMTLCSMGEHSIETIDSAKGVYSGARRIPINYESQINEEIKKLERLKIIELSNSKWCSAIVPVSKPDGTVRMCIDYRNLNQITIKDQYPLPRIDEILEALRQSSVFSTLDATSGYYQLAMKKEDKHKTAFNYKGKMYEFQRMPFGLCNAPATFQRAMDQIFEQESWKFVIPYLDDIIIFSKDMEEHKKHLEIVFGKLKAAGIALNENKCKLFRDEIKILGNIVSLNKVKPDPEKVKAVREYNLPITIKQLRSFLGLANYVRDFVPNFAHIADPLTNLLKGKEMSSEKKIEWNEASISAFEAVKNAITNVTFKAQPDFKKKFILITDASSVAIGAVLAQKDEYGKEQMLAAYSYKLNEAQRNYSVTDGELLAVVKGIDHFRHYLVGKEFELRTDHQALEYMWTTQDPTSRLLRWSLKLQEYKFKITYIKGETNVADGLSRPIEEKVGISVLQEVDNPQDRKQILEEYHKITGHGSSNTMKFLIRQKYKWKAMFKEIDQHIKTCETCIKSGEPNINTKNRIIETTRPNELWEIDLIGRIQDEKGGNKFIFVAIDHHTKWVETAILASKDAISTGILVKRLIIEKHGIPLRILTDNGLEFNNNHVMAMARQYGISWEFSSPNHHQTVGAVERVNQTLMNKLKKLTEFGKLSWEKALSRATLGVNLSFNRSIGTAPYLLKYGTIPNLEIDKKLGIQETREAITDLLQNRKTVFDKYAPKAIQKGMRQLKLELNVGDRVLIFKEPLKDKFIQKWWPGYIIKEIVQPAAYIVTRNGKDLRLNQAYVKLDTSQGGGEMS